MKTIKQKAKAYDEAIKKAKERYATCYSPALLEYIFPELKESNDKEIKKDIISNLKRYIKRIKDGYDAPSAKDFVVKEIEKQIAWLEKQGEQKPIDKVKPKFKVGDWICSDMRDVHIASIENGMYYFDEGDGLSIVFVDEHYHVWTIEDAMDGDVLVSRSPFIYGKQCPYGGLNWCNNKFIKASNFIFTDSPVHPATKEQRDFLFQKMKEAGYEWHINKKELRKKE